MKTLRIWFNKSFSSTYNVIQRLQETSVPHRFHVLCSHTNPEFAGFEPAAESFIEPAGLSGDGYLQYCLEFCEAHGVEVFVPGRARMELAAHREKFENLGVKLLAPATAETLEMFEDKARFYATIPEAVAQVPRSIAVQNRAEFGDAVEKLKREGCEVCIKPSASTGGLGFRILDDGSSDLKNLLDGQNIRITTSLVMHIFAQAETFRPMLVMEYLSGAEYSVDCLATKGRLLCAIPRRKPVRVGGAQRLENREELVRLSERVARHYDLDGIFNVQARYLKGVPKVLEINARMSGGIYMACVSGVDLPAWALALAAGTATEEEMPKPTLGFAVHQQYREFMLNNVHGAAAP